MIKNALIAIYILVVLAISAIVRADILPLALNSSIGAGSFKKVKSNFMVSDIELDQSHVSSIASDLKGPLPRISWLEDSGVVDRVRYFRD